MVGAEASAKTETPSMLAAKITMRTTRMSSNTPSKDERRDSIPAERQDVAIGGREGVNCTLFEDCVVDGFILHKIATKPSYASILKKGGTGARGYALAAAALSSIPAAYKTPTRKRAPARRITTNPNRLYLNSAATYHSIFCLRYMKNVRDAGRNLQGNCNAGVKTCTKVGDLGVFKMWINKKGIANLLSIPQVSE